MILHAGIKPFILSLLLLVHPGKNHPLPPDKRLTMTKKPCHDFVGNIGVCMFKYDCIRQKGITLTTCADGFLFGACCMLKSDNFKEDSRENFISESYSLLPGINFLTTPSFAKVNIYSTEGIQTDASVTLKTKEDYSHNPSESTSAISYSVSESQITKVPLQPENGLHYSSNDNASEHPVSPIMVPEYKVKIYTEKLQNISAFQLPKSTIDLERTTSAMKNGTTPNSTSELTTLSNFVNFSGEHTNKNNQIELGYSETPSYSTVAYSFNNTEVKTTTSGADSTLTDSFIKSNSVSSSANSVQNTNREKEHKTTPFEMMSLDVETVRPFSPSPLNWIPDHVVPESFQSVIAQLTSDEVPSPVNLHAEVKNPMDDRKDVAIIPLDSIKDTVIDEAKEDFINEKLNKTGQTTTSIPNANEMKYTQHTKNKLDAIDSINDKNKSSISYEYTLSSTFNDMMIDEVDISQPVISGFSPINASNMTQINGLVDVSQIRDVLPMKHLSTLSPLNSTEVDDLLYGISSEDPYKSTIIQEQKSTYTERSSITLPNDLNDFTSKTEPHYESSTIFSEPSRGYEDRIHSVSLNNLLDNFTPTSEPYLAQKDANLRNSSNSIAQVLEANNFTLEITELPFNESITPSQIYSPASHFDNSTKTEYDSKVFYASTSPLDTTPSSSVLSVVFSNHILGTPNGNKSSSSVIELNRTESETNAFSNFSDQSIYLGMNNSTDTIYKTGNASSVLLNTGNNSSLIDESSSTTSLIFGYENSSTFDFEKNVDFNNELDELNFPSLQSVNIQFNESIHTSSLGQHTTQTSTYVKDLYQDYSSTSDTSDLITFNISNSNNGISQNIETTISSSTISDNLFSPTISDSYLVINITENNDPTRENGLFTNSFIETTLKPEHSFTSTSLNGLDNLSEMEGIFSILENNLITQSIPSVQSSNFNESLSFSKDSSNFNNSEPYTSLTPTESGLLQSEYSFASASQTTSDDFMIDPETKNYELENSNLSSTTADISLNATETFINAQKVSSISTTPYLLNVSFTHSGILFPSINITETPLSTQVVTTMNISSFLSNTSSVYEDISLSSLNTSNTVLTTQELSTINANPPNISSTADISVLYLNTTETYTSTQDMSATETSSQATTLSSASTEMSLEYTTPSHGWNYRKDCGIRLLQPLGRIVGGRNSYYGKWPWQALVKETTWLGLFVKNKCGGVLITEKYVLTAAHCQPGFFADLLVILGTHDLAGTFDNKASIIRNVKRMVVHRHYNAQTFENDLALLEMEVKVEFLPHVVPICLPHRNEDFTRKMAFVTGWGKLTHGGDVPNILQEVQVPIVENEDCQRMFYHAGHKKSIRSNFVCAGYTNGGQDSCEGDSGGPLMVQREDKRWVLVGTVSHGIGCADPNLPGVYMRMSAYRPWIDSIVNKP